MAFNQTQLEKLLHASAALDIAWLRISLIGKDINHRTIDCQCVTCQVIDHVVRARDIIFDVVKQSDGDGKD